MPAASRSGADTALTRPGVDSRRAARSRCSGPVEVRRDGESGAVPGGKTSELLVRLALDAGVLVRTDRLVEDLWAADAVDTRRNTLQSKVAKLRRALGDPAAVVSGDGGYALAVEPPTSTPSPCCAHASAASAACSTPATTAARPSCARVDAALFRGRRCSRRPVTATGRRRTGPASTRPACTLLEIRFAARLRLGDAGDVIGELEAAVAAHPFHEGLWELLITALYRAGRQADALAAYQRVRDQLADELGLDPGPQLRELEQQILAHDGRGSLRRRAAADPAGNLPSMSAELVGRETRGRRARRPARPASGWSRSSGRAGSARPPSPSRPAARLVRRRAGGVWLARLESARTTADDVVDTLIAALHVTGGEAALFDRLRRAALRHPRQLRARRRRRRRRSPSACSTPRPGCASCARARSRSTSTASTSSSSRRSRSPTPSSCSAAAPRPGAHRRRRRRRGVRDLCRSLDGLPLAIELAAARTRTLSVEEITPPPRRPLRRAERPDEPQAGAPPGARGDDRVELRPAVPRRPARPVGAGDVRRRRTAAGGRVRPRARSTCRPRRRSTSSAGSPSRSLVIVDDEVRRHAPLPAARQHPGLRARGDDRGRADRAALAAHAAGTPTAAGLDDRCTQRPPGRAPRVRPDRARQHRRRAGVERHARPAARARHRQRVRLGLGRPRRQPRRAADPDRARCRRRRGAGRDRATALLLAGWIEASTGDLELARDHIAAAAELADAIDDVDLQARCCYYLAYVVSHHGEFEAAIELTDRSRALYDALDRPWDQAANALFAARAAISAGDDERSVEAARAGRALAARRVDDPWLHVRGEAMLGRARPPPAPVRRRRRPPRPALPRPRVGSASCRPRRTRSPASAERSARPATTTPAPPRCELAIDKAEATGDVRLAALARVHLGRVLRALGDRSGPDGARGGDRLAPRRPAAASRPRSASACWPRSTPPTARSETARRDPRRRPPRRRCPRRGLRPRRTRPPRGRDAATQRPREISARRRTGGWRPPRTSSPTATGPTTAGSTTVPSVAVGGRRTRGLACQVRSSTA